MSTTIEPQDQVAPAAPKGTMNLGAATALIVGSIIGVGVFNLPGSLAGFGPITLFSMVLVTIGAICLALLFASLSKRMPADGGPYAYSRAAFGNGTGFVNAWSYWITAWAGNAAIVVGWVFYVEYLFTKAGQHSLNKGILIIIAMVGLWGPALINMAGVQNMASVQVVTTVLKFIALAFMSTVALFFIKTGNFHPWNVSGGSNISAIGTGLAIGLFAYLGVETAAVAAAKVKNPDRNVPKASIYGTLATAAVYLLSLTAVFGIVPNKELQSTNAPYSTAVNIMFGGSWAGYVMAGAVVISGFGALNGWTMICAEMPLAAANDGLFPTSFAKISNRGVPAFGIIASTILASIFTIISYLGSGGYTVWNTLVFMSGITAAIPYAFSALAQIKWRLADKREINAPRVTRDLIVAVLAVAFSILFIYYSRNTDETGIKVWMPFIYCAVAFLIGIPVYFAQRTKMQAPPPVPPYRP